MLYKLPLVIRLQCLAQFWDFTLTPSRVLSCHRAPLVQADMVPVCYHELTVGAAGQATRS